MEYLSRYSPRQARRHEVRPGITGWAQINGRNALSWGAKLEHDVWYVEHWSLGLDFKILLLTVARVVRGDGVQLPGVVDDAPPGKQESESELDPPRGPSAGAASPSL
jgi:sugar transferase EpsL